MKGLFEKQIRKHFEFPTSFKISTADTVEEANEEEIQKLLKIVVEAQKEYPRWNNNEPNSTLTYDVLLQLVKDKDAWFLRNFGDLK